MDENKKKNNYMINSCLGKRPKVESMGNYMAIICFKKNTRSATQGDACYRRDARIIINIKK